VASRGIRNNANCIPLETCRGGGGREKERRKRERERKGEINFISGEYFTGIYSERARVPRDGRARGRGRNAGDSRRRDTRCYRHPVTHPVVDGEDRRARFLKRCPASVLINRRGGGGGGGGQVSEISLLPPISARASAHIFSNVKRERERTKTLTRRWSASR